MVPSEGGRSEVAQLRRGVVQFCVLALLRDGEKYGFELVRKLCDAQGLVTSEGTIYPLLSRLRNKGLVSSFWQESQSGPPRRYYKLTPAGSRALTQFTADWVLFRTAVDHMLDIEENQA
ncbi:PadR family transcriptional regulator [Streptomyces sp. NPDC020883]|uniref:PadR family transcriptional regulator n=1 Tax=Streptomyces sp. NPDC020883 TaxID=3365099 RepID=UPI0037B02FC8